MLPSLELSAWSLGLQWSPSLLLMVLPKLLLLVLDVCYRALLLLPPMFVASLVSLPQPT